MTKSRVFRFVFSILTGTLYQIVLRMPNKRRLTSDEMHVCIGMLEAGSSQRMWQNTWMCHRVLSSGCGIVSKKKEMFSIDTVVVVQRQHRIFQIVALVF